MSIIAIIVIIVCLMAFFGTFILWVMQILGKVRMPENQSNKIFSLVVVCILTASGGFVSTVFYQAQYEVDPYIGFMSDNRKIQLAVQHYGFYEGEIDGVVGNGTLKAVKQFQEANSNLSPTGGLDQKTMRALFAYLNEEPFSFKRYFNRIKKIQTIFQEDGLLDKEHVNGIYDKRFLSAVGEFQSKHYLDFDHDLGSDTLLKLVEYELNIFKKFNVSADK